MSDDGRYVVFDSDGKQVIPGSVDADDARDVYLYDRTTGSIERISDGVNGAAASVPTACEYICGSQRPTISADGRFVAFWSNATNLVANDTNGKYDAFLFDRQTQTMTRVSNGYGTEQANGHSRRPVVSRDGAWVAFESAATNLIGPVHLPQLPGRRRQEQRRRRLPVRGRQREPHPRQCCLGRRHRQRQLQPAQPQRQRAEGSSSSPRPRTSARTTPTARGTSSMRDLAAARRRW